MGSHSSHLHDPSVSSYAEVRNVVIFKCHVFRTREGGCCGGVMYIKEDSLYYKRNDIFSYRYRFKFSDIDRVEIVNYYGTAALKVSVHPCTTVWAPMPDAAVFVPQLAEAINSHRQRGSQGYDGRNGPG